VKRYRFVVFTSVRPKHVLREALAGLVLVAIVDSRGKSTLMNFVTFCGRPVEVATEIVQSALGSRMELCGECSRLEQRHRAASGIMST